MSDHGSSDPLQTSVRGKRLYKGKMSSSDAAGATGAAAEEEEDHGNMITRSKPFQALAKWAFKVCDADGTGEVGRDELYTGVILVHLTMAKYAGAAACFPATRETVNKLFDASDADGSGSIDEDEFVKIMVVVCGSIFSRIALYFALLLFISPIGAKGIVFSLAWILKDTFILHGLINVKAPLAAHHIVGSLLDWDTIAEDLIGKVVFFVAFPIIFGAIDEFYQSAAEGSMLKALDAKQVKRDMNKSKKE